MLDCNSLRSILSRIDGRGYKAYKDIEGTYQFKDFNLIIDRVAGDPFASPSKLRILIPKEIAAFPENLYDSKIKEIALRDYLTRQFDLVVKKFSSHRGTGKSGLIAIAPTKQEVIDRSSAFIDDNGIEIRFLVGLPARGRTVLGFQATAILCEDLPKIVEDSLKYSSLNSTKIQKHVETVEDADWLRQQLKERGLVAFVANGAILPRRSGIDDRPLLDNAIPFQSPLSLEVEFNCPNCGLIKGMGIKEGITLIVGGGYHGKSTLLRSIELGVYDRIPGDGREFVVADSAAVKIRAEDGRAIVGVDISPFINKLPQNRSTVDFYTANASGSTSQAANIIEAIEVGAKLLLIDEDTAATNFMIRDRRMQQLIAKDNEPITPFIDKVRQLYANYNISTILVIGGSGDYFEIADTVIAMENFLPQDVTVEAKEIAASSPSERISEGGMSFGKITRRIPLNDSIDPSRGRKAVKLKVRSLDEVCFGNFNIDLAAVEQIVDSGQLQAIAEAIIYAKQSYMNNSHSLGKILDLMMEDIEVRGLDVLTQYPRGDLVLFRRFELAGAINRLRSLRILTKQ